MTVGVLEESAGFYLADDGPGIPPDECERVFETGYSTADDGSGFGLAIVRDFAEAHGWEITLAESEAGGAQFDIREIERQFWRKERFDGFDHRPFPMVEIA